MASILRQKYIANLIALQESTVEHPYSISHRLELAKAYRLLGYPDLAASDAYKALLLIDEVVEEGEYHENAFEAAKTDFTQAKLADVALDPHVSMLEHDGVANWAQQDCSIAAYDMLIGCLLDCGSLRSAFDYIARARKAFPDFSAFEAYDLALSSKISEYFGAKGLSVSDIDVDDYPDRGLVRREQYPWNDHEPQRTSEECLEFLNDEMSAVAPKLEVKVSELPVLFNEGVEGSAPAEIKYVKQLGVFAKQDIAPGELILEEKSLLTAISRLHDIYCDACSLILPSSQEDANAGAESPIVACEECDEVFFCSIECHNLAQDSYHASLCGVSVEQGKVSASDAADALYTSLLVRALALAQTQGLHPLELKELRYIWGDYHGHDLDSTWKANSDGHILDAFGSVPQTLPFSFKSNVLTPLHMLENMEVNIYTESERYDTWVFNTIFAKLRGTASAQQGPDGRPEIGAVHPLWCLANHSCDPNVAWKWQGSMRFWAREDLVKWGNGASSAEPGIKKGEELFSHYCDITLPVKERREWAIGALGGECMCPRCRWESTHNHH